jgi:hypothetical protein
MLWPLSRRARVPSKAAADIIPSKTGSGIEDPIYGRALAEAERKLKSPETKALLEFGSRLSRLCEMNNEQARAVFKGDVLKDTDDPFYGLALATANRRFVEWGLNYMGDCFPEIHDPVSGPAYRADVEKKLRSDLVALNRVLQPRISNKPVLSGALNRLLRLRAFRVFRPGILNRALRLG